MNKDMIFLSNSIDDTEKDIIGFNTYVEKLNSAIDENAQMIAITSPFGSGKTSIVELLKKKRKDRINEKFLHIQMWSELNTVKAENNSCELHKNFLYQIGSAINQKKGTYINRRLSNNYGLLKLHSNRPIYWICLVLALSFVGFGWLSKNYSEKVLEYIPSLKDVINHLPVILFFLAVVFFLVILIGAEIIFSSKASETQRVIEPDEIIDLYRNEIIDKKSKIVSNIYKYLKETYPCIEKIKSLEGTRYIVVIEDLDRTNDGASVIHFLKELRKYYILSNKEENICQNKVVFIVNIKPESMLNEEINASYKKRAQQKKEQNESDETQDDDKDNCSYEENRQNDLYFKLFDYVLNLQTINITDYETILCNLLNENEDYLKKHSLTSASNKFSDIPGMQWIIRGKCLGIREIKNRLNIASVIFEALKERFPLTLDGIEFKKCAAAAYLMTEYELDFSKTDDNAFESLNKQYLLKDFNIEIVMKNLATENKDYAKAVLELVEAKMISEDYRMYYYNYPKNSVIYNGDETNIQNAILYGISCKNFDQVAKKVVDSDSDIVEKTLKRIRQLELPIPQLVIKNESLFLSALKYDKNYVFEVFDNIRDTDEALNKNIRNIISILKYDSVRQIYTPEIISEFCARWEKALSENHLISLRETICAFFTEEIYLYKQLFFGEHGTITVKEMSSLPFQKALDLLNVESKNFSVSHLKYIIDRFTEEENSRDVVTDKICQILMHSSKVFPTKEIAEYILLYMLISNRLVNELESIIWNLLCEEPVASNEEDEGITYEKQNELFQKYKEVINSTSIFDIPDIVLEHINANDNFDDPYGYSSDISNLLFDRGYFFTSVLIKLHNSYHINFSDSNIIESIKEHRLWAAKHKNIFLRLRKQILLCANNIYDYQFCFASDFPLISNEEFLLLTNKNIAIQDVLDFFPADLINEEAVEYITKYLNKKHINNNDSFEVLLKLLKHTPETIRQFFDKIDFSYAFSYFTFAEWRKTEIKNKFQEALYLDTNEGKLIFMENTKYLDEKFEKELIGNTDENMEGRYAKLVSRRRGPASVSSTTIKMLKSFNKYYSFGVYSGVNEKMFDDEEYEYYVVSKTLNAKKFVMETGERLERIWPTYIEIFSNPSRLSQTVSYMGANKAFLERMMLRGIYTGFEENTLNQFSSIKQDSKLIEHVYSRGTTFAIDYFSSMEEGFVDEKAAKTFIDLLSLETNKAILKNEDVRDNIYDKLIDPVLKGKYTKLRRTNGFEQ